MTSIPEEGDTYRLAKVIPHPRLPTMHLKERVASGDPPTCEVLKVQEEYDRLFLTITDIDLGVVIDLNEWANIRDEYLEDGDGD